MGRWDRDAKALDDLDSAIAYPTSHHRKDAWEQLIFALCKSGKAEEAQRQFEMFVAQYHPGVETTLT